MEIIKIENIKTIERISETKSLFFGKINKTQSFLPEVLEKKKEDRNNQYQE